MIITFAGTTGRKRLSRCLLTLAVACASLGLAVTLTVNTPGALAVPTAHASSGQTCFATFDNGATVFSGTTASAPQQAVDAASPGLTVKVAGNCPGVAARLGVSQTLYVSQSLTIRGGYSPGDWSHSYPVTQPTTLDAVSGGRGLYLSGGISVTLDGLHITGGNAHGLGGFDGANAGGGLYNAATAVTVLHSAFDANTAGNGTDSTDVSVPAGNGGLGGAIYNGGSLVLSESTLTGNSAGNGGTNEMLGQPGIGGWGGAIYNASALTIISSSIDMNFAGNGGRGGPLWLLTQGGHGGGIFSTGSLSIISSTLSGNGAGNSGHCGGICNQGILTVTGSTLSGNTAGAGSDGYHVGPPGGSGGGIFNEGTLIVRDSVFTNNYSGAGGYGNFFGGPAGDGGGIFSTGPLTVSDSAFRNNVADVNGENAQLPGSYGGAIAVFASRVTLANDLVIANSADYIGGGLYLSAATVLITNSVIADNQSGSYGSGVVLSSSSSRLAHTTIARNSGGDGSGLTVSGSTTLINTILVSHTVGITVTAGSTATVNSVLWHANTGGNVRGPGSVVITHPYTGSPAFANPDTGDYHLTAASAAINRGIQAGVRFDLDGRPRDPAPDLGAYEYQFAWPVYLPSVMRN